MKNGNEGDDAPAMYLQISLLDAGEVGGRQAYWMEFVLYRGLDPNQEPYILKILCLRQKPGDKSHWLVADENKLVGLEKFPDQPTQWYDDDVIGDRIFHQIWLVPVDRSKKLLPAEIVTRAGNFQCSRFVHENKTDSGSTLFECAYNDGIPFGLVQLDIDSPGNEGNLEIKVELIAHGKDAKSMLPE